MEESTRHCIRIARHMSSKGNFSKSFGIYIALFEKNPRVKDMYEAEFRTVLVRLNTILDSAMRAEEVFSNFERALKVFPNNHYLLNDLGKFLFKYRFYNESMHQFQKALKKDSGLVNAEKNLNSVKNLLVAEWHFRMLNDRIRNEAYRRALKEIVSHKESVLDIGTGTGLLALYASESQPITICGCDSSEEMVNIANCIVEEANKAEIQIVKGSSCELSFEDIGGKKTVLVTELFDAGLFGEHVLQALAHARANLITSKAKIIPNKAEFFIVGAKCDCINLKYQLGDEAKKLLNIPNSNVHVSTNSETYDCEDVPLYKDLKYITQSQSLIKINFNDNTDLIEKLEKKEPYKIELKAIESGEINVLIGWFNLYLTDKVTVTTDPQSNTRATAWQQAVFFDSIPINVEANQTVELQFALQDNSLTLILDHNIPISKISPETLRFLNDSEYMKLITKCLGTATFYLGQLVDTTDIIILDLCPFPVFGLLMLKRGVQSVTCCAKTEEDKEFFEAVMSANNIPEGKLTIIMGSDMCHEAFKDQKFHAMFCNILDLSGDIDIPTKDLCEHLKTAHLVPGGLYMPARITLISQLVSSRWLDFNNRVYDENASDYKIAKYINKFQVSQNFNIDISCLEYTAVSEAVSVGSYDPGIDSDVIDTQIVEDGIVNAILCWYRIEFMEGLGEISTNVANSFIDSMAFLADPSIPMEKGNTGNIICCVDIDGAFKLLIDFEYN